MDSRQTTIIRPEPSEPAEHVEYSGHAEHEWSPLRENGEHKSSEEIETDIRHTRKEMDQTMDRLGYRVHPRTLLDQFFDMFREEENRDQAMRTARDVGYRAMESLGDNPFPVMLIAAGAGWLFWNAQHRHHAHRQEEKPSEGPGAMERGQEAMQTARDRVSGTVDSLRQKAEASLDQARDKARQAGSDLSQRTESYREGMYREEGHIRNRYGTAAQSGSQMLHEHPLAVGIAAMAAGILAGLAFPASRTERELMGEESARLKEQATAGAREVKAAAQETARETLEAARSETQRQGLTPDQISEKTETEMHKPGTPEEKAAREGLTPRQTGEKAGNVLETAAEKAREKVQEKTKS